MYSNVGIIFCAVVSAILSIYVFVPDGGLRIFDYWLDIWQPIVWDVPAAVNSPSLEQAGESQYLLYWPFEEEEATQSPFYPSFEEEKAAEFADYSLFEDDEVMDENRFQFISEEDIMERLRALSDLLGPEIGPRIPPRVPLSRMLCFHQAVVEILLILWPQFIACLLPCLLAIALAHKTCALRKLQKLYEAEKRKDAELLAVRKSKEYLDKTNAGDEDEEENRTTSEQLGQQKTETLDDAKANDDRIKEIVAEGPSELLEAKGLPAKRHRPGKRNGKRDHKFEAEKKKRKQAEKKAALVAREGPEKTHEKK